jgi:hypothetical protein
VSNLEQLRILDPSSASAISMIVDERIRQVTEERFTIEHDDSHRPGDLAMAGGVYAISAFNVRGMASLAQFWPWGMEWWKRSGPSTDLTKAGALIIAEMSRMFRAQERSGK